MMEARGKHYVCRGGQLDIETAHYPGLKYDFEHAPQNYPISFGEFGMLVFL